MAGRGKEEIKKEFLWLCACLVSFYVRFVFSAVITGTGLLSLQWLTVVTATTNDDDENGGID